MVVWRDANRERERATETERKKSEYYGSSKNICQFRRYTCSGLANQSKNYDITSEIQRKKMEIREEIRVISCLESFFLGGKAESI